MKSKFILMKFWPFLKIFFGILFFLLWSPKSFALAGFAERSSYFHYNNFADIHWGHPSDGCFQYGYYCFYLIEKNQITHPFNESLRKINIPIDPSTSFVLMESMSGQWVVYDLKSYGIIFESDDFESALHKWNNLGFLEVKFADATNLSDYFPETKESKEKNRITWSDFFFVIFLEASFVFHFYWKFWLAVVATILLILGVYIHERYYSSTSSSPH